MLIGQEMKWERERERETGQERSCSWDSISGRPQLNGASCRHAAAIGTDHLSFFNSKNKLMKSKYGQTYLNNNFNVIFIIWFKIYCGINIIMVSINMVFGKTEILYCKACTSDIKKLKCIRHSSNTLVLCSYISLSYLQEFCILNNYVMQLNTSWI